MTGNPTEGGVYRRNQDGSLTRLDPKAQDLPPAADEPRSRKSTTKRNAKAE